jgi:hypothetical protein
LSFLLAAKVRFEKQIKAVAKTFALIKVQYWYAVQVSDTTMMS